SRIPKAASTSAPTTLREVKPMTRPSVPQGSKRYRLKIATWTIIREATGRTIRLSSPEEVAEFSKELLRTADDGKEHFWVLLLGSQNDLELIHEVSMGSLSASIVHPREVLGPAIREGAAHLVLVHNHPSGDPSPS